PPIKPCKPGDQQCVDNWARDQAVAALQQTIKSFPAASTARNQLANTMRDQEAQGGATADYGGAIAAYRDAIDHKGGADAYFGRGTTLSRMPNRLSEAAESFKTAIQLAGGGPSSAAAHVGLGKIYYQQSLPAGDPSRSSACLVETCNQLAGVT